MDAVETAAAGGLEVADIAIIAAILVGIVFLIYTRPQKVKVQSTSSAKRLSTSDAKGTAAAAKTPATAAAVNKPAPKDTSFVGRMKTSNKNMVVFYGSQTGTAEDCANRLAKEAQFFGFRALALDVADYELSDLARMKEIPNSVAIFCIATYGEGEPTDSSQAFHDWLIEEDVDANLSSVAFTVFALGNKTYEHYNAMGRLVDKRLEELGGQRLYERGEGDDDGNLEEDFVNWKQAMWPALCTHFGLPVPDMSQQKSLRQYTLKTYESAPTQGVFIGEMFRIGSYSKQQPPFDAKNPFLAKVAVNRELHKSGNRSCRHIELDITGSGISYQAGDHVAVYAENDPALVDALIKRLGADANTIFSLEPMDVGGTKKRAFPLPCTYRTAFLHYLDITSIVRTNVLRDLAEYASDPKDKDFLLRVTSPEGKKEYHEWVVTPQRTLLDALEALHSWQPPIDHVIELLPRLQCRYYSISSSPKAHPQSIHVTSAVVMYTTSTGREAKGVATNWLKALDVGAKVPVYVRRSTFRLPKNVSTPAVMIGPGTGLAPFRGFIQDRAAASAPAGGSKGAMVLFFGCRNRASDFIYEDELRAFESSGAVALHVAFSRDQATKDYVTHHLRNNKDRIWELIDKQGGHLYVCGDGRHMSKDVHALLLGIVMEKTGGSAADGEKYIKKLQTTGRYQQDVWS
eukprot:Opistho-2@37287